MSTKPLITVIITNYNYGHYVAKAIKSVFAQTYPNIELIVIDDGSADDSDEIIKEVIRQNSGRNIKYVNHRKNKGVIYTRNEGIKIAGGKYICYLDADDYFNRSYISKSYKIAKEHDADVVYPNWHFLGEWEGRPDTDFPEFKPELLQLQKLHVTPASLVRKAAIKHYRFEADKVAEDWDFFIGLSLEGAKFKLAKDNLINYRIRKGTRSSKYSPQEDTEYFVEILTKYKAKYGDKVIDPAKLVSIRHPNIVMRVLRMQVPRIIIESIKKDGVRATARKILRKVVARSGAVRKVTRYARNRKYQALSSSIQVKKSPSTKLAVVLHLYYPDLWPVISQRLKHIHTPFDLYVSVQQKHKGISLDTVNKYHKTTNIIPLPNRGRDVLPFLLITRKINQHGQYEYILKLHSKKSPHRKDGDEWLSSLLDELIPDNTSTILNTLKKPSTGAIGPASHVVSLSRYMGANKERIHGIVRSITNEDMADEVVSRPSKYPFFGGTMFWCRADYLSPLLKSSLTPADFHSESGQVDGTTAHAIERILGRILHEITNKKMYIAKRAAVSELPDKAYIARYKHVG